MNIISRTTLTCTIAAILTGVVHAEEQQPPVPPVILNAHPEKADAPKRPTNVQRAMPVIPQAEPPVVATGVANAGFATTAAFSGAVAVKSVTANAVTPSVTGTALTAPITIDYAGSSPVLAIQNTGTNRGVSAVILNPHDNVSALYGQTNGGGAGLTGYNYGTSGPAAKFGVVNTASAQASVFATTNGTGPAVLGTITSTANGNAAVMGQNTASSEAGIGVEGMGNEYGLYGVSPQGIAVYATSTSGVAMLGSSSTGAGVNGYSGTGTGVVANSNSSYGLYASSDSGIGIYGFSTSSYGASVTSESGTGLMAHSAKGMGLYSSSDSYYAIWGQSKNSFAIIGEDSGSGTGVFGTSATGYAGFFDGKVGATSYITLSDRNAKTHIHPIDAKSVLERVVNLPISGWEFKKDLHKNHMGPMAQDFHAAFGLDGADDTHINLTDAVGVSLASIQELGREMQSKDAEIAALKRQVAAQTEAMARMQSVADKVLLRVDVLEQQRGASQAVALRSDAHAVSPSAAGTGE